MHRHPGKYSPPPHSPDVHSAGSALAWARGSTQGQAGVGADAHPGFLSPHCALPYDNGDLGLVSGQLSAEKGTQTVRNSDTPHGVRWLKSNQLRLANLFTFIATVSTVLYGARWT